MVLKKHWNAGRAIAVVLAAGLFQTSPTIAQTTNECTAYSIQVCQQWDALGYSSLKDCRLQEYANCRAGVPPYEPLALKPDLVAKSALQLVSLAQRAAFHQS